MIDANMLIVYVAIGSCASVCVIWVGAYITHKFRKRPSCELAIRANSRNNGRIPPLQEPAFRCSLCGEPLYFGDKVSLRGPWRPDEGSSKWTTWHYDQENFRYAICCTREKCAVGAAMKGVIVMVKTGNEECWHVVEE